MKGSGSEGFTYLEVLIAVVVLASSVLAASFAVGQARYGEDEVRIQAATDYLLQDAIAWVRALPRMDVQSPVFGAEAGDPGIDDVDDLDGLVETAPVDRAGRAASADWQRRWTVESVAIDDPATIVADGGTALMRVRVVVLRLGADRATMDLLLARTP